MRMKMKMKMRQDGDHDGSWSACPCLHIARGAGVHFARAQTGAFADMHVAAKTAKCTHTMGGGE